MKSLCIMALLIALANPLFSQNVKSSSVKKVQTTKAPKVKNTLQLLQGKWRSMSDKTNYLVFYNHYRKELSGRKVLDENTFVLTDKCPDTNTEAVANDNGKYISQDDMCWFIVSLTKRKLVLSNLVRGNSIIYIKLKR